MNTRSLILSLLLITAVVRPLAAQPAPDWDRRAAGISTAIDPASGLPRITGHASLFSASLDVESGWLNLLPSMPCVITTNSANR